MSKTPHKHAELIKAWADGAEIEYRAVPGHGEWLYYPRQKHLVWDEMAEFRIKPEPEPKPDFIVDCAIVLDDLKWAYVDNMKNDNIRLTFDGETGKLKKAEVLE